MGVTGCGFVFTGPYVGCAVGVETGNDVPVLIVDVKGEAIVLAVGVGVGAGVV
jgi:hypothetical protein